MNIYSLKCFLLLIFFGLFSVFPAISQEVLPDNLNYSLNFKGYIYEKNKSSNAEELNTCFHTSAKPYIDYPAGDSGSFLHNRYDAYTLSEKYGKPKTLTGRKLTKENLLHVNKKDFELSVDPLFNFNFARDLNHKNTNYYRNTRGLLIKGKIAKKLWFETSYYENQSRFVNYIDEYIISTNKVVPGYFHAKNFKASSYDYGAAYGRISYTPYQKAQKSLNFLAGTGKNSFGDGYRSLLLSDFSAPYPFLKITFI